MTESEVTPVRAATLVGAVFEAVSLLVPPPSPEATPGGGDEDPVAPAWAEHLSMPFPRSFLGIEIEGVELILLDSDIGGLVQRELDGGLDGEGVASLWSCIAALDKVAPRIHEAYCAHYFARLRTVADLVATRYLPSAT